MSFISRQCSLYLAAGNEIDFLNYQTLSGLGFNKIGLYQSCISDPNNQFYLLQGTSQLFGNGEDSFDHYFMSGICFNKICTASDLQYIVASFQQYIKNLPFQIIKVQTPSLIQQEYDWETITVIITLLILFVLFTVCSIIDILSKKHKNQSRLKFIEIFSVVTTFRLLESRSQRNNERVKTFSGVKALCLALIGITNVGIIAYSAPTTSFYSETQDHSIFISFYGVDIWLMTTGFFISYVLLKQYHKHKDITNLILKILRRFLRLWPIYLLCLFLNWDILPLVGRGPLWPLLINPQRSCTTQVGHIFMISNFIEKKCYNPLWLLELDFQLCFIFVPLLILYIKSQSVKMLKYVFYLFQFLLLVASLSVSFYGNSLRFNTFAYYFFHSQYYNWNVMPFVRCGGFLIGYNLGITYYFFKKAQNKESHWLISKLQKRAFRLVLPVLGILGLLVIFLSFHGLKSVIINQYHIFYFASLRTIIPLLIAFIFIPSLFGYLSAIKILLESWICNLLSKLSLSIFSVNFTIALSLVYYRQFDFQLSNFTAINMFCCTIIPSIIISIIFTSMVEIPVFVCKKIYWKTQRITYFEH